MATTDYSSDSTTSTADATTSPGKYIKIAVPDFMNTGSAGGMGTYLRLGAVEDPTKAGKATGTVGLVVDFAGNPLVADPNASINPAYDPYAPFGSGNLPADGITPLPPGTTPNQPVPAKTAPANPSACAADPTGEDLASLVQGFADDTRNRGKPATMKYVDPSGNTFNVNTPGGQPRDTGTTAQGPLYGWPWTTPVPGAKTPGQDVGLQNGTEVPAKPPFYPQDYRTLESSQLHTKGGWRDHTDGNRVTTTRGDKIEVIRGNYKLIVLGRQDQTKPKLAGMDISGGQTNSGGGDLGADASTDPNQGSTAYSSLFEWRQCTTSDQVPASLAAAQAASDAAEAAESVALSDIALAASLEPAKLSALVTQYTSQASDLGVAAEAAATKAANAAILAQQALTAQQNSLAAAAAAAQTAAPAAAAAANQALAAAQAAAKNAAATYAATIQAANTATNASTDATTYASLAQGQEAGAQSLAQGGSAQEAGTAAGVGAQGVWQGTIPSIVQAATAQAAVAVSVGDPSSIWVIFGTILFPNQAEQQASLAAFNAPSVVAARQADLEAAVAAQEVAAGGGTSDAASATAGQATNANKAASASASESPQTQLQAAQSALGVAFLTEFFSGLSGGNSAANAAALQAAQSAYYTALAAADGTPPPTTAAGLLTAAQTADGKMQTAWTTAQASQQASDADPTNATAATQAATDLAALATAVGASQKAWTAYSPVLAVDALIDHESPIPIVEIFGSPSMAVLGQINKHPYDLTPFDPATSTSTQLKAAATAAAAAAVAMAVVWAVDTWAAETPAERGQAALAKQAAATAQADEATAQAAAAAAQAAEMGVEITPLLQLKRYESTPEDENSPPDFRSVSTTKKGSGPKVQLKHQGGDPRLGYTQGDDAIDGRTFGVPISMGVSINETWSYQVYNYTGIGYYPATQPQPWDEIFGPPPPKTQMQSADKTQPIQPPDRVKLTTLPKKPEWVIFPVSKQVTKNYVWNQSSETYIQRTITLTAGPRLPDKQDAADAAARALSNGLLQVPPKLPLPTDDPKTTYAKTPMRTYKFKKHTYDRDLLHHEKYDVHGGAKSLLNNLGSWATGGTPLDVPDLNPVDQTWTESHVSHQATVSRLGTTVADTIVGQQYAMTHAQNTVAYTSVTGLQHTITHAASNTSETYVPGLQTTESHIGNQESHSTIVTSYTTSAIGAQQTLSAIGATDAISAIGASSTISAIAVSFALKAMLVDLQISLGLIHIEQTLAPKISIKNMHMETAVEHANAAVMAALMRGETVKMMVGGTATELAMMHLKA
ncbi:MAG TPA: hypothetical protein VGM56_13440 [Byssovorax sp.]|jgi:hypothetical protein